MSSNPRLPTPRSHITHQRQSLHGQLDVQWFAANAATYYRKHAPRPGHHEARRPSRHCLRGRSRNAIRGGTRHCVGSGSGAGSLQRLAGGALCWLVGGDRRQDCRREGPIGGGRAAGGVQRSGRCGGGGVQRSGDGGGGDVGGGAADLGRGTGRRGAEADGERRGGAVPPGVDGSGAKVGIVREAAAGAAAERDPHPCRAGGQRVGQGAGDTVQRQGNLCLQGPDRLGAHRRLQEGLRDAVRLRRARLAGQQRAGRVAAALRFRPHGHEQSLAGAKPPGWQRAQLEGDVHRGDGAQRGGAGAGRHAGDGAAATRELRDQRRHLVGSRRLWQWREVSDVVSIAAAAARRRDGGVVPRAGERREGDVHLRRRGVAAPHDGGLRHHRRLRAQRRGVVPPHAQQQPLVVAKAAGRRCRQRQLQPRRAVGHRRRGGRFQGNCHLWCGCIAGRGSVIIGWRRHGRHRLRRGSAVALAGIAALLLRRRCINKHSADPAWLGADAIRKKGARGTVPQFKLGAHGEVGSGCARDRQLRQRRHHTAQLRQCIGAAIAAHRGQEGVELHDGGGLGIALRSAKLKRLEAKGSEAAAAARRRGAHEEPQPIGRQPRQARRQRKLEVHRHCLLRAALEHRQLRRAQRRLRQLHGRQLPTAAAAAAGRLPARLVVAIHSQREGLVGQKASGRRAAYQPQPHRHAVVPRLPLRCALTVLLWRRRLSTGSGGDLTGRRRVARRPCQQARRRDYRLLAVHRDV
mmetsp:Transcript_30217/g.78120  ORF Transcript_30217/g.78120 Transcript_30217/m.78120 type:complete len:745 (-) Transcript_30217:798-3032(-)